MLRNLSETISVGHFLKNSARNRACQENKAIPAQRGKSKTALELSRKCQYLFLTNGHLQTLCVFACPFVQLFRPKRKRRCKEGTNMIFPVLPPCLLLLHFFTSFTFYYLTDFKSKTQSFTVSGLFSFDNLTFLKLFFKMHFKETGK